jgi:hypothetical protein
MDPDQTAQMRRLVSQTHYVGFAMTRLKYEKS